MRCLIPLLLLLPSCTSQLAKTDAPHRGIVVSASDRASEVGARVLRQGGNAVDATVATAFALAVTFPEAGNIGGGGFMLVHFPDGREPVVIDYRETAPAAVDANTFRKKSDRTPYRLAGVPGTVRGLALAHEKYGKLAWRDLVSPAVELASNGFVLNADLADSLNRALAAHPEMAEFQRVFGNRRWKAGDVLVQRELAETLRRIADGGPDAFYTGPIADQIVAEMKRGGGLITHADLAGYRAQIREPIHGKYRVYDVYAPPPPSSGGVALVEALNVLEYFPLYNNRRFAPQTLHLITEAMRRAYADRAKFLGDPDFAALPDYLLSKDYAAKLATHLPADKATASRDLTPDVPLRAEPENTTHFSVVDRAGMAVANTYTLEESYGGKIVVAGAGLLLNNELGDFNPQPGVTTVSGQIGTRANLAAPGKRPLSSMCPTIVARDGKAILVTGSPGGRTIINTVLCVVLNRLEFDMPPQACVDAPRHHHQWFPDQIVPEAALAHDHGDALEALKRMGHTIAKPVAHQGDAHSIFRDLKTGQWTGAADHRRAGAVAEQ